MCMPTVAVWVYSVNRCFSEKPFCVANGAGVMEETFIEEFKKAAGISSRLQCFFGSFIGSHAESFPVAMTTDDDCARRGKQSAEVPPPTGEPGALTMDVAGKRVRKKSKRLSEQDKVGEKEKRGGRKRRSGELEDGGVLSKRGQGRKGAGAESVKKEREHLEELVVSYAFAGGSLALSGVPMSEIAERKQPKLIVTSSHRAGTPQRANGVSGGMEGAFPRRTMNTKFKNSKFTVSGLSSEV